MRAAALALIALALAAPAGASEQRPTAAELESELVCPVCETTLDTSNAPVALRMKAFIRERIAAGDTKSEIKARSSTSSARRCWPSRRRRASS